MRQSINKVTLVTAISLLSLTTLKTIPVEASNSSTNKDNISKNKFQLVSLFKKKQALNQILQDNEILIAAIEEPTSESTKKPRNTSSKLKDLKSKIPDADKINHNIQDRYLSLVEKDTEKINLFDANKILKSQDNEIGAKFNRGNPDTNTSNINNIDYKQLDKNLKKLKQLEKTINSAESQDSINPEQLKQLEKIINSAESQDSIDPEQLKQLEKIINSTESSESKGDILTQVKTEISSNKLLIMITLLVIIAPFGIMIGVALTSSKEGGVFGKIRDKYGKPKVPDGSISLHERSFKELTSIGLRADKLDDEKFGNAEFLVLLKMKYAIAQGGAEYEIFNHRVELLRAAIAAKNSFLRLEQTELRYRSRKQQEFYTFVADNIDDGIDKNEFRDKVKKKLAEVIPLITTAEGRDAMQGYIREVDIISEYDLGLKLLSLFKKYELADFAVLATISNILDCLQTKELLESKGLTSLVLENFDAFEQLSPIIGISEEENLPKTYAKILQYIGLMQKHADSYKEFEQLTKLLKEWQKPYNSVIMVREEYTANEYRLPKEFTLEIPGLNTYQKYAKYLA